MLTVPLAASVTALAAALLLVAAGLGHARRPAELASALRRHRLLGAREVRVLARSLGPAETVVGAAALGLWTARPAGLAFPVAVTAVILTYVGFGAYTVAALRSAPGAPCGCFGGTEPLTWAVPARALVFAVGSAPALAATPPTTTGERWGALGAAVIVALLGWAVPALAGVGRRHPLT